MGGGGGQPANTTTTTKTEIDPWMKGRLQELVGLQDQYNLKPYMQYGGTLNAPLSSGQQGAGYIAQAGANGGLYNQQLQNQALQGVVGGNYNVNWQQNPYAGSGNLDQLIGQTNQDVTDSYNKSTAPQLASQFAQGGAFGGSAMNQAVQDSQQTLADRLAANTTGLRYQDLQNQQTLWQQGYQNKLASAALGSQNMLGAANTLNGVGALQSQYNSQLAGIGQVQQDKAQGDIDQAYNNWYQQNYGYDQQRINNLGNVINGMSGQFTGSSTSGANPAYKPRTAGGAIASGVGGAAAGGALGAAIAGGASGSVIPGWGTAIGAAAGLASYYL